MSAEESSQRLVYSIEITGRYEGQVHGRHLREEIVAAVHREGRENKFYPPMGFVRNIKEQPRVLVKMFSDNAQIPEKVRQCVERVVKEQFNEDEVKDIQISEIILNSPLYDQDYGANASRWFSVYPEDNVSEMVWALQGAGRLFAQSAKTQEALLKTVNKRDETKEYFALHSLNFELTYLQGIVDQTIKQLQENKPQKIRYSTPCLEKCVTEPPYQDTAFVDQISQLRLRFQEEEIKQRVSESMRGETEKKKSIEYLTSLANDTDSLIKRIDARKRTLEALHPTILKPGRTNEVGGANG